MSLLEVTPLASPPVPRTAFARRLGLSEGFGAGASPAEDSSLDGWLLSATAHIERRLGFLLTPRACVWTLSSWPLDGAGGLRLPMGPLAEPPTVSLLDSSGAATLWTGWSLDPASRVPRLRLNGGGSWPQLPQGGAIRIAFTAGLNPLPPDLAEAVLSLAAHWFENRESSSSALAETPFGLASLLAPYAPIRL